MQGEAADIWKENILEDLEARVLKFKIVGKFLKEIKKEFGEGDEESNKIAELKEIKQGSRKIEEFVQKFRKVAWESGYKGRPLVKEFK